MKLITFQHHRRFSGYPRLRLLRLESRLAPALFTVTNLNDAGAGSLRQAVLDANVAAGADTIDFAAGVTGTITLTTGSISITSAIEITGPGPSKLIVSGNNASRVFVMTADTVGTPILIQGLTLTKGRANDISPSAGGAILCDDEALTIRNCIVSNSSADGVGGGVYCRPGILTIEDCSFNDNSALGGGAIYAGLGSKLTIRRSTVSENSVDNPNNSPLGGGGGIAAYSLFMEDCVVSSNTANGEGGGGGIRSGHIESSDLWIITNSTLFGNKAESWGGGLKLNLNSATASISNTTISNNLSKGGTTGGGVFTSAFFGISNVSFRNCTITGNSASSGGGIATKEVGGTGSLELTLNSTIIAGNVDTSGTSGTADFDFESPPIPQPISGNNNLIGIMDTSNNAILTGTGNLTGTMAAPLDAKLGMLANNGGLTPTHRLLEDSPAINMGNNAAGLMFDQRGSGYPRIGFGKPDIGAFELSSLVVTNNNDSGAGSLRQAITIANSSSEPDIITFDESFFGLPRTIKLTTGGMPIVFPLTIAGPVNGVTIDAQKFGRIFNAVPMAAGADFVLQRLHLANAEVSDNGGAISADDADLTLQFCSINSSLALNGGAIWSVGKVVIEDSVLTGNMSLSKGGAIYQTTGKGVTIIRRSTLSGNTAGVDGGAMAFVAGGFDPGSTLEIESSTLSNNIAGGSGGALYIRHQTLGNAINVLIRNSTLSGNIANINHTDNGGGAIFSYRYSNSFLISNTTISGNAAPLGDGGGVRFRNFFGNPTFENCTITGNSAKGVGGGLSLNATGTFTLSSTIVAGNTLTGTSKSFDVGTTAPTNISGNNNLIGIGDQGYINFTGSGNLKGTFASPLNAKLGLLTNNGGPTMTHALLPGSPALNAGNNASNLVNDQRGVGFARVVGAQADIGAFEDQPIQPPAKITAVIVNNGALQRSVVNNVKIVFDSIVTLPGSPAAAFDLVRPSNNKHPNLAASVDNSGSGTVVTLTFLAGESVEFGSLADGLYNLTVFKSQINGGNFDSFGSDVPGNDYVTVGSTSKAPKLFRMFGDADANGTVNALDFATFRSFFGLSGPTIFDSNGDNQTNSADFAQFRARFGIMLTP